MFKKLFVGAKDGQIFEYQGHEYMKLTGIVAIDLENGRRYFLGLDF